MIESKYKNGLIWMNDKLEKVMFLEDISNYLRFSIYDCKDYEKNLKVSDELEEYFRFNDWRYIEYDLISEITSMIIEIFEKGKSFIKIIYYKENEEIKGIELRYIPHIKFIKLFDKVYTIQKFNNKYKFDKYNANECIFLNAKDIRINKIKTKRILKKLSRYDYMKAIRLSQKGLLSNSLEEENEKERVKIFKTSKEFYWDARDNWSKYLNSPYILYRYVKRYLKLISILEKTIYHINKQIKTKIKICNGQIIANVKDKKILNEMLEKILNGTGSYDEISNYIFNKN